MKKIKQCKHMFKAKCVYAKTILIMQITIALLLATCLQTFATGTNAQSITISKKNSKLGYVFREINKQTEVEFVYNSQVLKNGHRIDVEVSNATLDQVLKICFKDQPFTYVMEGNTVVVKDKVPLKINDEKVIQNINLIPIIVITGKVTDADNKPLVGVSILLVGETKGTSTDENGQFSINVPINSTLQFSYVGYEVKNISVKKTGNIKISLKQLNVALNDIVVVGYGKQKKATMTGAIVAIDNKQLVQSPVSNISNSLAGRLSGLIAVQNSGEPGFDGSSLKIRGIGTLSEGKESDPLIMLDGVPQNSLTAINRLDPNEIQSVSILKDASATAVFGVRGANGVIIITTKSGVAGKPQISFSANSAFQTTTQIPQLLNSYEYASLRNEAQRNMGVAAGSEYFSEKDLELYKNGTDPYFHPDVDWFKKVLKKSSRQQQYNLNIGGGSKDVRYFVSLGYFDQDGAYNVGELQKEYSANPKFRRYNLRSNFDIDFNKDFTASIRLGGQIVNSNYPGQTAGNIFFRLLGSNPLMNPGVVDGKIITTVEGLPASGNILDFIANSGYQDNNNSNLNSSLTLTYKLDALTKGLKARVFFAYDNYYSHNVTRTKGSARYRILKDPADPSKPIFIKDGEELPFGFAESFGTNRKIDGNYGLDYDRSFGNHNISALVLYTFEKSFDPALEYHVPHAYTGVVGRVAYNYKSRYMAEFNLGYNGSENFPADKRFGFFPAYSAGWTPSNESFFPKNDVLTYLKFRASYGEVGNDQIGNARFLYLPSVFYYGNGYNLGELGNNYQWYGGSYEGRIGNPDLTWERAKKTNLGVEAKFIKDKLSVTLDVFNEKRNNILSYLGTVPAIVAANLPPANIGKVNNHGYEIEASYNGKINKLTYWMKANYSFAKNKIIYMDEPVKPYEWMQATGRPVGQYFGLVSEEFFNTQKELDNAPASKWSPKLQLGDVKYKDLNGDKLIDEKDMQAIGYSTYPQVVYGVSTGFSYKGFDFSILFQGVAKTSRYLDQIAAWPFETDWGSAQKKQLERWTPERYDAGLPISFPRVELSALADKNNYVPSSLWLLDGAYLRIKNIEAAYSFSGGIIDRMGAKSVRFFFNANNLVTWSKIKNYDPELPSGRGEFYPQMKVYNFGANLQF